MAASAGVLFSELALNGNIHGLHFLNNQVEELSEIIKKGLLQCPKQALTGNT